MRDRYAEIANAFDDPRRSNAFIVLMLMYKLKRIADKELEEFEDETRNAIREVVDRSNEFFHLTSIAVGQMRARKRKKQKGKRSIFGSS
ncbi:MAG: hypothetical protein WBO18_17890 [Gammaproteobacteria bacterium]